MYYEIRGQTLEVKQGLHRGCAATQEDRELGKIGNQQVIEGCGCIVVFCMMFTPISVFNGVQMFEGKTQTRVLQKCLKNRHRQLDHIRAQKSVCESESMRSIALWVVLSLSTSIFCFLSPLLRFEP